jgi:hypothetical protein
VKKATTTTTTESVRKHKTPHKGNGRKMRANVATVAKVNTQVKDRPATFSLEQQPATLFQSTKSLWCVLNMYNDRRNNFF